MGVYPSIHLHRGGGCVHPSMHLEGNRCFPGGVVHPPLCHTTSMETEAGGRHPTGMHIVLHFILSYQVCLTHFDHPNHFYVVRRKDERFIESLQQELNKVGINIHIIVDCSISS